MLDISSITKNEDDSIILTPKDKIINDLNISFYNPNSNIDISFSIRNCSKMATKIVKNDSLSIEMEFQNGKKNEGQ